MDATLPLIAWSPDFATGLEDVDRQHKRLIGIIATLQDCHRRGCGPREAGKVLQELQDYTRYHFQNEEDLMECHPVSAAHRRAHLAAHQGFVDHLARVAPLVGASPELVGDYLLSFLMKWLVHHITRMDGEMAREMAGHAPASDSGGPYGALVHTVNELYEGLGTRSLDLLETNRRLEEEIERRRILEARLRRMGAMYLALGKTNRAVAFRYDRDALLQEVCGAVAEHAGFAAAIALFGPAGEGVRLGAFGGSPEDRARVLEFFGPDQPLGEGSPVWPAVAGGTPLVRNDWGPGPIRSFAVFPLMVEGMAVAALAVFSQEAAAFEDEDVGVLKEMAAALSFGLESLEREEKRRHAEARLRESQNRLSRLMDLVPLMIYIYDLESGATVYANQAVQAATGYSPEEIVARRSYLIQDLAHPADRPAVDAVPGLWAAAAEGEVVEHECRIGTREGAWRHIAAREVAIARGADGRPRKILGVAMDVTVRVWQRLVQEQKLSDFARMGRLVNLGEMASAVAHELNQPLTAIANFTQACVNLLKKGKTQSGELEQALRCTAEQALRAGSILHTMREFVRRREARPAALDIGEAVREVVDLAKIRSRSRRLEFALKLDPGLPLAWADRILVEQVLMNLVRNAEEAMEKLPEPVVEIATELVPDGFVQVSVRDVGLGLPEGFDLERLPAFFTTKADGMGVGLGICRGIVEASGGRIWAEAAGEGSVFRFTLPLAEEAPA